VSFSDPRSQSKAGLIGESTLRQAQGDNCHGELVEPWIVRSGLSSDPPIKSEDRPDRGIGGQARSGDRTMTKYGVTAPMEASLFRAFCLGPGILDPLFTHILTR